MKAHIYEITYHQPLFITLCLLFLNSFASNLYGPWNTGSYYMPYAARRQVAGYDEESNMIYLIGGQGAHLETNVFTLFGFNLTNNSISGVVNYGLNYFDPQHIGWNVQHFVQHGNYVYNLRGVPGQYVAPWIMKTHVPSRTIQPAIAFPDPNAYPREESCITSITLEHDYLIVTNYATYIYDLTDNEWMSNNNKPTPVTGMSGIYQRCHTIDQTLYVIGGDVYNISMLDLSDITNIASYSYEIMQESLSTSRRPSGASSIVYGTDIVIIGGGGENFESAAVDIIDTISHTVRSGGPLSYAVIYMTPIVVFPYIYVFGGSTNYRTNSYWTSAYQYFKLELSKHNIYK